MQEVKDRVVAEMKAVGLIQVVQRYVDGYRDKMSF